jgi:hypothetical protein
MKAHFAPCESCGRHIRVSEGACPFCDAATSPSFRARSAPVAPSKRLSRAALFVFGAASATAATAIVGCSSSSDGTATTDGGGDGSSSDGGIDTMNSAAYGLPADTSFLDVAPGDTGTSKDSATTDGTSTDTSGTDTSPAPAYGLPPDTGGGGG